MIDLSHTHEGGPIIGGPKAAKPCENQLKAVIRSKIKCKAAAAMVKHAFLAQNIANYPLMKENETLQQVHVRHTCALLFLWFFFDYKVQLCNLRGHSMSVRKKVSK